MRRWWLYLLLALSVAAIPLLLAKKLHPQPKLLWVKDYMPSMISRQHRSISELAAFGRDSLIESGLMQRTAVCSYDGKLRWEFKSSIFNEFPIHTAVSPELNTYIGTNKNNVYALDRDGKLRWRRELKGTHVWSAWPAVSPDGSTVYVAVSDEVLYALRAKNGDVIWRLDKCGAGRSTPIPSNSVVYTIDRNLHLNAYGTDGSYLGQSDLENTGIFPPVRANGSITTIDTLNGQVNAIDEITGKMLWTYSGEKPNALVAPFITHKGITVLSRDKQQDLVFIDQKGNELKNHQPASMFTQIGEDLSGRIWIVCPSQRQGMGSIPLPSAMRDSFERSFEHAVLFVFNSKGQRIGSQALPFFLSESRPVPLPDGTVGILGSDGKLYCYSLAP